MPKYTQSQLASMANEFMGAYATFNYRALEVLIVMCYITVLSNVEIVRLIKELGEYE